MVLTCNDSFSREALALLDSGGRDMAPSLGRREGKMREEEASAERSESEGRDTDPEGVCLAGLLMRRLMSRWPLANGDKVPRT